jgi:hypothetical protein
MVKLGNYCKAYNRQSFEKFPDWNLKKKPESAASQEGTAGGTSGRANNEYLYLHDAYCVTTGIFPDRDVLFDNVTPEWIEFCNSVLGFKVSTDVTQAQE